MIASGNCVHKGYRICVESVSVHSRCALLLLQQARCHTFGINPQVPLRLPTMGLMTREGTLVPIELNAFSLAFDQDAILEVEVLDHSPFEMDQLWAKHRDTHFFRREGDHVLAVPLQLGGPSLGGRGETRRIGDVPWVVGALLTASLLDLLHQDREVVGRSPLRFRAAGAANELLAKAAGPKAQAVSDVHVRPLVTLEVVVGDLRGSGAQPYLLVDVAADVTIDSTCDELARRGLELRGHYVGVKAEADDPRVTPKLQLLGRVATVEPLASSAVLDDARDGEEVPPLSSLYVEPRFETAQEIVLSRLGPDGDRVWNALRASMSELGSGPGRRRWVGTVRNYLVKQSLTIAQGIGVTVDRQFDDTSGATSRIRTKRLPRPVFEFDPAGSKSDTWAERGLKKYGPFSARTFTPTEPRVAVLCRQVHKGEVEQFMRKLLEGVRIPGDRQPFDDGMLKRFSLSRIDPVFFLVEDDSAASYREAALRAVQSAAESGKPWDLAYVQIKEEFRERPANDNPYLVTKSVLLTHGVPVQQFKISKATLPNEQLAYILNSVALASYGKLGGTPWLIHSDRGLAHELVVGLGSVSVRAGRLGGAQRYVGITTVFSGDGRYHLARTSRAVPFDEYSGAVLESLRSTISRLSQEMNWRPGDSLRLVFHTFKPIKDAEADAITGLVSELVDYDLEFAALHLADNHHYRLFDSAQPGKGYRKTGQFVPDRGLLVPLGDWRSLLTLQGPQDMRSDAHGAPRPLELFLHKKSTFRDMDYLAKQVMWFSANSWRSYSPAQLPVTIFYSELIARMLAELQEVRGWDPDVLRGKAGRTRWFL